MCLLTTIIALLYYRYAIIFNTCVYIYVCNCIYDTCRKTLLRGIHNFIHLNLAIALLMGLLVFVGGIERATEHEVSTSYLVLCLISL